MRTGSCIIDGVDVATLGVFIERGGSDDFLSFPDRRSPDQNDWPEHDGLDIDMSDISFEAKKVVVRYVIVADDETTFKNNLNAFESLHIAPGYRAIYVDEFKRVFQLRFISFNSYTHRGGLAKKGKKTGKIIVEYSMDDPLQLFTAAIDMPISSRVSASQITINGMDMSRFGIIVRDIYSTALRPRSAKSVLERKIYNVSGLIADTGLAPERQARQISIECTMVADSTPELVTNWNALFNNLRITSAVEIGINRTGEIIQCYYSKMTNYKKDTPFSRKVKVSFNLILQEVGLVQLLRLLASHLGVIIVTEDDKYIEMKF